jgi:hypothetical protein
MRAKVWFIILKANSACLPLRPTSVGNMLLRCLNNLDSNMDSTTDQHQHEHKLLLWVHS